MNLKKTMVIAERWLSIFLDNIRWPAAIVLLFMALLTMADVIGRYVFLKPILGNNEIQQLMMVIIIFLAMGYCTLQGRHANADVLITRLPPRSRAIFASITWFISAAIYGLISWYATRWGIGELRSPTRVSTLMVINESPYIMVAAFGCITICLGSLVNFFRSIGRIKASKGDL